MHGLFYRLKSGFGIWVWYFNEQMADIQSNNFLIIPKKDQKFKIRSV